MEITQTPKNWQDLSEHDINELDYKFKLESGKKYAVVSMKCWNDETEWTLKLGVTRVTLVKAGKHQDLKNAVEIAEKWIASGFDYPQEFLS